LSLPDVFEKRSKSLFQNSAETCVEGMNDINTKAASAPWPWDDIRFYLIFWGSTSQSIKHYTGFLQH